jgi:hypothetical protein
MLVNFKPQLPEFKNDETYLLVLLKFVVCG